MIIPELRRGESKSSYVQRCRSGRDMSSLPLASVFKTNICQDGYDVQRKLLR
jgi:hypothetical protein